MNNQLISVYQYRRWIGWLGLLLVPGLLLYSWIDHVPVQQSISDYYYTAGFGRTLLTAVLSIMTFFLLGYRGYDKDDRFLCRLMAFFALGIAVIPDKYVTWLHDILAIGLFESMGAMCFQFAKSERNQSFYHFSGIILFYFTIPIIGLLQYFRVNYGLISLEFLLLSLFGINWLLKGWK